LKTAVFDRDGGSSAAVAGLAIRRPGQSSRCGGAGGRAPGAAVEADRAGTEGRDLQETAGHHHVLHEVNHLIMIVPLSATALIADLVSTLVCRERLYHGLAKPFIQAPSSDMAPEPEVGGKQE
jgi:hypothetical protein